MQEKIIQQILILKIPANKATARAPLGPTLGQYSIPIAEFCNRFNSLTEDYIQGVLIKAKVILYEDQSYEIEILDPDAIFFIKTASNIEKCMPTAGRYNIQTTPVISAYMLYEIASIKHEGSLKESYQKLRSYYRTLIGTIKSTGIIII